MQSSGISRLLALVPFATAASVHQPHEVLHHLRQAADTNNAISMCTGVATFNNYASQSSTVCGQLFGVHGTYGAAAGDISPNISGGLCDGTIDMSKCNGQSAIWGYNGPNCPKSNCGTCYKVVNNGGYGGVSVGGVGNSVIVQIIDSCPSVSAANYCKTESPAEERCGSSSTNQLDIDESAYPALTGQWFGTGPNLPISITPISCP